MPEPTIIPNQTATRLEQIEAGIAQSLERKEPLRFRVSAALYDGPPLRGYTNLRDAAWSLAIDAATPEYVERIVKALELLGAVITEQGPEKVITWLELSRVDTLVESPSAVVDPPPAS